MTGPVVSQRVIDAARAVPCIVAVIRRSSTYWAPEISLSKILDYLSAYGSPLYRAIKALPADEREACGVDLVRQISRAGAHLEALSS